MVSNSWEGSKLYFPSSRNASKGEHALRNRTVLHTNLLRPMEDNRLHCLGKGLRGSHLVLKSQVDSN